MFKNKKSVTESPSALLRIIITVAIFILIVFPACNKIRAAFFSSERMYLQSFLNFIDNINKMPLGRETFEVRLKEKSAIIGFSKNAERYACFNCYYLFQDKPDIIFEKPKNEECIGNACICLCSDGFELEDGNFEGRLTKFAQCSRLICKKIEQTDIIDKVMIRGKPKSSGEAYWNNGFLFSNDISGANGLNLFKEEINVFTVEKRQDNIGVCNSDILKFNRDVLKINSCINKDYNAANK